MIALRLPTLKHIRSNVIKEYLEDIPCDVIILSCGNAYNYLKQEMPERNIIGLSTSNHYKDSVELEDRLYTKQELNTLYPKTFNASPGMLPEPLYKHIGEKLFHELVVYGYRGERLLVPCGSGETLVSLGKVIPNHMLVGYYDMSTPELCFDYSSLKDIVEENFTLIDLSDNNKILDYIDDTWIITLDTVEDRLEKLI